MLDSKLRTEHGIGIRLCHGHQRRYSASFGTHNGAIRDRQKSFRAYDNASSVDEHHKSPRDARASVSGRFYHTRPHDKAKTQPQTKQAPRILYSSVSRDTGHLCEMQLLSHLFEQDPGKLTQAQSSYKRGHFMSTGETIHNKRLTGESP